jgi:VCBS repeat-containing protein
MANFNTTDLEYILTQIKMAETNTPPVSPHLAFGLREVAGTNNNTVPGQSAFGSSDLTFTRIGDSVFQVADTNPNTGVVTTYLATSGTVYDSDPRLISNLIADQTALNPAAVAAQDKALAALGTGYQNSLPNPAFNPLLPPGPTNPEFVINNTTTPTNVDASGNLFINNVTPDAGLSAPSNEWFTFFGQFFDHGLDLVTKGGNGKVKMLLSYDDALYNKGVDLIAGTADDLGADGIQGTQDDPVQNFMILTRATQVNGHESQNTITPFVDQSQTYASHSSHQVFLREYAPGADGALHSTGKLLSGANGKMATWADLKSSAVTNLGLKLSDHDVGSVPTVLADAYGNVIRGPGGFAQVTYQVLQTVTTVNTLTGQVTTVTTVLKTANMEGTAAGLDVDHIVDPVIGASTLSVTAGNITTTTTVGTHYVDAGSAFLNDIAHNANPFNDFGAPIATPDGDNVPGNVVGVYDSANPPPANHPEWMGQNREYDDELLNAHYVAGDGRLNENIGLTAVHEIFHSEHDRLVDTTKATIQDELSKGNVSFATNWVLPTVNLTIANGVDANGLPIHIIQAGEWNGERLFQAAKFGTETQYQHLVFEEFARKIAPDIHLFGNNDIALDPAISAEFAHAVYRFGHSMLDENVNRYILYKAYTDAAGNQTDDAATGGVANKLNNAALLGTPVTDANGHFIPDPIGLIAAFTNPLAYAARGVDAVGQLVQGSTHQVSNEIDEFVTGALRNNLLGQPLDLGALNIARGRDAGIPPINELRNQLFSQTHDQSLRPYESWDDFGNYLKHPASLINFVAAYGTHTDIVNATTLVDKRTAALDLVKEAQATTAVHPGYVDVNGKLTNMAYTDAVGKHTDFQYVDAAGHYTAYAFTDATGHHTADANAPGAVANIANTANTVTTDAGTPVVDALGHVTPIANPDFVQDAADFMQSRGAYVHDLGNALAQHTTWSNGDVTGLDNVDLWIAGLAEKQNLFGGLLGSTFNYIFKQQMEHLQDGDRLYYLPRIEGLHWGSVIEDNSFQDLISRNTGVHHLPASIFLTPEYTVEASTIILRDAAGNVLHNADGSVQTSNPSSWAHNAASGAPLVTVLNDGTVKFVGDDNFLGNTMVLGGTQFDDKLEAGHADDDTVYGDGGNDNIDGGGGNDFLYGGTGDDFIHDIVGDNVIHGDEGNDTIIAGRGDDILFGGDGNDYIETGDAGLLGDSAIGGLGNDILVGGVGVDTLEGNEGDDWLEGGANGDMLVGDVGAPTGQVPLYGGNDVLDGGAGGDVMKGFSGDDIMLGAGGFDKFEGRLGFDWASWENAAQGVDADMNRREFIPNPGAPAGDAVRDFFIETEAASGSRFDDFILGTNRAVVDPFNNLTNVTLITGLADYFDPLAGPVNFSGGNILFGAGGSDQLTGGGGNDIIDGDARLHVALSDGHTAGSQIIREILYDQNVGPTFALDGTQLTAGNIDVAVYNDVAANYTLTIAVDALGAARLDSSGNFVIQVTPVAGNALAVADGTDLLFNMERVQFTDVTIDLNAAMGGLIPFTDAAPTGALTLIDNGTPIAAAAVVNVGDSLTFSSTVNDVDGVKSDPGLAFGAVIPNADLQMQWQSFNVAGKDWVNVAGATSATFTPTDNLLGQQLRLQVSYVDALGLKEVVHSPATAVLTFPAVVAVNHAPTVVTQVAVPGIPDTQGNEDKALGTATHPGVALDLINIFTDDTTPANRLGYAATLAGTMGGANVDGRTLASIGLTFSTIPDPANPGAILGGTITGTPPANFSGPISIRVTATDAGGLSVQDTFVINVLPVKDGVAPLEIDLSSNLGTPVSMSAVGKALTANLGPDPDNFVVQDGTPLGHAVTAGPATFAWMRDGFAIFGQNGSTYTPTLADVGKTITVKATYIDANGFHDVAVSANGDFIVDPLTPAAPHVVALTANITEDAASLSQNLLAGAFDPNGDTMSVVNVSASVTGSNPDGGNRVLGALDFTITPVSATDVEFALTAAGLKKFDTLAAGVQETFTVSFGVTDGTTTVNPNTTPNTFKITVTGTNDAPVVTGAVVVPGLNGAAILENGPVVTADALAKATDVDIGDHLSVVNLPLKADGITLDLPAGVTYNAVTHLFSLDPNDPAYNALREGQVRAVTINYGVTDGKVVVPTPASVTFNVTGKNDAPTDIVVTANAGVVGNNNAPGNNTTIANLAAVDADNGDPHTFTLLSQSTTSGNGAGVSFAVNAAGAVTHTAGTLANNSFALDVQTSDGIATYHEVINVIAGTTGNDSNGTAINGTALTDIIYALSGNDTVNGGAGDDTLFGQSGSDILTGGAGNDTLYGGNNSDNFVITAGMGNDVIADFQDGSDRIAIGNFLNLPANATAAQQTAAFNAHVTIANVGGNAIVAIDGIDTITLTGRAGQITQADFNFAPTGLSFAHNQYKVTENAVGAKIDDVIVHDGAGDTHTFVISDNRFEIVNIAPVGSAEQLVLKLKAGVSLDYETAKTIAIDVSVFDSAGQASKLNPYHFTLQVQNVNEAPTHITPVTAAVAENSADGSLVATLSSVDPEGNTVKYALADTADGRFTVVGNQIRVAHSQLLDFESNASHTVNVIATDSAGLQSMQTVTINVGDVSETPTQAGGAAFDALFGTAGADRLAGGASGDLLSGDAGDDYIDGGTGGDFMLGGAGNDTYVVDDATDNIMEAGNGNDTVITSLSSYTLASTLENLINSGSAISFTGVGNGSANIMRGGNFADNLSGGDGNDLLIGGSGNDVLSGGNQNDEIYGGAGIDKIVGGAGNDTMSGGAGNDTFSFASGFGNDKIMDFDAGPPGGQDLIDLRQLGITDAAFAAHVTITDVGADVLITIDNNVNQKLLLAGIADAATITKADFLLFAG